MADEQRWRDLAEAVVTAAGFDLEDFQVVAAGRRRTVQVVVDGDDGLPLDAAATISRSISEAYDVAEADGAAAFGGVPYTLEVSSPGIGRPLTLPRHFDRSRGRLVTITTAAGTRTVRVLGVDGSGLDVLAGQNGTDHERIPLSQISRAKVDIDFSGPAAAVRAILEADPRTAVRFAEQEPVELDGADDTDADDTDTLQNARAVDELHDAEPEQDGQ